MAKKYLTTEMLETKVIGNYLSKMSVNITEEQIDEDQDFVVFDADDFRHGICHLFAFELNRKYGYPMFIINNNSGCHIFCKSKDGKFYIDVRGFTDNFSEFISGTEVKDAMEDSIQRYEFEIEDLKEKYVDEYRAFARVIIQEDEERYVMPAG